ncbi:hypothetical protein [Cupriavidus sp.]|uniref:hypothetical protein n=1 Tax=Cupriavidus sp. TaxID=1873897 RepID=UPI003D0D1E82
MTASRQPTNHPSYFIEGDTVIWSYNDRPLWGKDGNPLPIARPQAFRCIDGRWFTDGEHVIVQAQQGSGTAWHYFYRIEDADPATFEVLNERYARDARQAYFITGKTIRTRSPQAFRPLTYQGWHWPESGPLQPVACTHAYYAVDAESAYFNGKRVIGADGATVVGLPGNYIADAGHVYYFGQRIDADRASLVVAPNGDGPLRMTDKLGPIDDGKRRTALDHDEVERWRDFFTALPTLQDYWWHRLQAPAAEATPARDVLYGGHRLTGLDPDTFAARELPVGHGFTGVFCGDAHSIRWLHRYSEGPCELTLLSSRPISSLQALGDGYLSDGVTVFYAPNHYETPQALRKVDPAGFTVLQRSWARDASRAFHRGKAKKGVNPDTLRIAGCYAWDDAQLFCDDKPLKVAAPHDALQVPHPGFLLAGEQLFFGRRPVSARRVHLPTLEFLDADFARDRKHAYIVGYVNLVAIDGADPATFRVLGKGRAADAAREYDAAALKEASAPATD